MTGKTANKEDKTKLIDNNEIIKELEKELDMAKTTIRMLMEIIYLKRNDLGQVNPDDLVETNVNSYEDYIKKEHDRIKNDKEHNKNIASLKDIVEKRLASYWVTSHYLK
jgi:hypothetical protein